MDGTFPWHPRLLTGGPALLDAVLEWNRGFLSSRAAASPVPAPAPVRLVVVACDDPRLDTILLSAMGLSPGEAVVLRSAGAQIRPSGETLRSLALSVYLLGATEVMVVGHTACHMARLDPAALTGLFQARGVPRDAFGPADLRDWAGAMADPKQGVQTTVAQIAASPFLPRDVSVSGMVLDDDTGALDLVVRGVHPTGDRTGH